MSANAGFRVVATRRLAQAGFLGIDELDVAVPGGGLVHRVAVRHPGAVVVVPVEADRTTALLVRQYRAACGGDVLEACAGKRDVESEPPEVTAARELEEELGLRARRLVKLAEFFNSPGFCDEYAHTYLALDLEELGSRATTSPEEHAMTVERVSLSAIEQYVSGRRLVDAKTIIGLLLARQWLAGAHPGIEDRRGPR